MNCWTFCFEVVVISETSNILRQSYISQIMGDVNFTFFKGFDRQYNMTAAERSKLVCDTKRDGPIFLAHLHVWTKMHVPTLVLEDDAIPRVNKWFPILKNYLTQIPAQWDYVDVGEYSNFHGETRVTQNLYIQRKSRTRTVLAYLFNPNCAKRVVQAYRHKSTITKHVDIWLNEALSVCKFGVYWTEPSVFKHGSQQGIFRSWRAGRLAKEKPRKGSGRAFF